MLSKRNWCNFFCLSVWIVIVASGLAQSPKNPSLFLNNEDFFRIDQLVHQQAWAAKEKEKILKKAAGYPNRYEKNFGLISPDLPPEGGQWIHLYVCPQTGTALVFHPPDKNVCPDNGKEYKGFPYDQVIYSYRASDLAGFAVNLALSFRLSGNHSYAEESANILKAYADHYLEYKIHDRNGTDKGAAARVYAQTLDEAEWLIAMASAYDLIRDTDVLGPADRLHIENDLLRPSALLVSNAYAPTLNWQAVDVTALAAVGYVLGDNTMIHKAIDGPDGALPLLRKCVVDGFWIEGSWNYQFLTMSAYMKLAEMALHHGRNLWQEEPRLKAMFESPIGIMFPNGDLPAFNDSVTHNIRQEALAYEAAFAVTGDPLFGEIIQASTRENNQALLFGVAVPPSDNIPKPYSQLFSKIGFARLSSRNSDLTEVIKFGPHGGVHGHFDKLNEIIYAQGRIMSVDPGTQLYGAPTHATWDKQSVAHNTVVVDETTQHAATGKLIQWQVTPEFTTIEADAGAAYNNATLTRRVVLTSRYILEITTAESTDQHKHIFDWIYHNVGKPEIDFPLQAWSGFANSNGYQHLKDNKSTHSDSMWQMDFHVAADKSAGEGYMHILMLGEPNTRVISGYGLGPDLRVPVPYIMARRKEKRTEFAVVIEPYQSTPSILKLEKIQDGKFKVTTSEWIDTITIGEQTSVVHVENNLSVLHK